jgi:hypothetical protein
MGAATVEAPAPVAADVLAAASSVPVQLILELGWTLHPPEQTKGGKEGGEGEEEPELEFSVAAFNVKVGLILAKRGRAEACTML